MINFALIICGALASVLWRKDMMMLLFATSHPIEIKPW